MKNKRVWSGRGWGDGCKSYWEGRIWAGPTPRRIDRVDYRHMRPSTNEKQIAGGMWKSIACELTRAVEQSVAKAAVPAPPFSIPPTLVYSRQGRPTTTPRWVSCFFIVNFGLPRPSSAIDCLHLGSSWTVHFRINNKVSQCTRELDWLGECVPLTIHKLIRVLIPRIRSVP